MKEQFKPIEGFENYAVSDHGRIMRLTPGPMTAPGNFKVIQRNKKTGYCHVKVSGSLGKRSMSLHRLVAEAFLPNPEGYKEVDHIDRDKTNNHIDNLRWCTRSENLKNMEAKNGIKQVWAIAPDGSFWIHYESLHQAARNLTKLTGKRFLAQGISNVLNKKNYTQYKGWKFKPFDSTEENHTY
jgi:hypothetical protein